MEFEKPKASPNTSGQGGTRYDHPAFGEISVTRGQGQHAQELFGSPLKHRSGITVTLTTAYNVRDLSRDWIMSDKMVTSFTMSEFQWASLISAVNGGGVPVTYLVRPTDEAPLMSCPQIAWDESQKERLDREIKEKTERYLEQMRELTDRISEMAGSGKANKTQLNELAKQAKAISEGMPNSMAFIQKQGEEAIAATVAAGKAEMEAYVSDMAQRTGLDLMRSQAPALDFSDSQKTKPGQSDTEQG